MKYITPAQYAMLKDIPRGRLTAYFKIYTGVIIENDNKILLCQPRNSKYPGWQLPGGKVLWSETFQECITREVLEETGLKISLEGVLGIFQRKITSEDEEFLRIIYTVKSFKVHDKKPVDTEIIKREWFEIEDILKGTVPLQSQQILKEVKIYRTNKAFPLGLITTYEW